MSDLDEKVKKSIERLRAFCPPEGYYLAFSGGKDSVVCKALLDMSGCKYDATYRVTSVDPPELVRFIKEEHPDVKREVPRDKSGKPVTMWNLIEKNGPPVRNRRFCCRALKESSGDGRITVTGVRWAESVNRRLNQGIVTVIGKSAGREYGDNPEFMLTKRGGVVLTNDNTESRRMVEQCYKRHKTNVNPIIEWSDANIWGFIRGNSIPYCELYDEGFHRLGCIGCPFGGKKGKVRDFMRWPKYKNAYMNAFAKFLKRGEERGNPFILHGTRISTAQDVFNWWMEYDVLPGQYNLFEDYEEEED